MRLLANSPASARVTLADGVTALGLPPAVSAFVPDWWAGDGGVVPAFDLELWAAAAVDLTAAELYGAAQHPLTFADITVTANATTNVLTFNGHARLTGDGPILLEGADVPLPADTATRYWLVRNDANTVKLAESLEDALAGVTIDLADAGSGTIKIVDIPGETMRVHWHSHGLLGPAGDGAIALDAQRAYWVTLPHRARVIAYAIAATLSTPVAVYAAISHVQDA